MFLFPQASAISDFIEWKRQSPVGRIAPRVYGFIIDLFFATVNGKSRHFIGIFRRAVQLAQILRADFVQFSQQGDFYHK